MAEQTIVIPKLNKEALLAAVDYLIEKNAWILPLPGQYGRSYSKDEYDEAKKSSNLDSPVMRTWKKSPRHVMQQGAKTLTTEFNTWIGLVPASVHLLALDVDTQDTADIDAFNKRNKLVPLKIRSPKKGLHYIYHVLPGTSARQTTWAVGKSKGDVRYSAGYIILWDPAKLIAWMQEEIKGNRFTSRIYTELMDEKQKTKGKKATQQRNTGAQNQTLHEYIKEIEADPNKHYPPGGRNEQLRDDMWHLIKYSAGGELYNRLLNCWLAAHSPDERVKYTQEFNSMRQRSEEKFDDDAKIPPGTYNTKNARNLHEQLMQLGLTYSWNIRKNQMDWKDTLNERQPTPEQHSEFELNIIERIENKFWFQRSRGKPKPLRYQDSEFRQFMLANIYENNRYHDDFRRWIESLPPWDKTDRLENLIENTFGIQNERNQHRERARWASLYLCLAPIQRTYRPGCKIDEIPVLIGEPRIGKSALIRELLPPERLQEWHQDQFDITAAARERRETLSGRVLIELAEMANIGRQMQKQKAWLTSTQDTARDAYARKVTTVPRRFAIIGTADRTEVLPRDPSGNRRFVIIKLKDRCNIEETIPPIREQLWAEALFLYNLGMAANLPAALYQAQANTNNIYIQANDLYDNLVAELDKEKTYTVEQLLKQNDIMYNQRNANHLATALKLEGWIKGQYRQNGTRKRAYKHKSNINKKLL